MLPYTPVTLGLRPVADHSRPLNSRWFWVVPTVWLSLNMYQACSMGLRSGLNASHSMCVYSRWASFYSSTIQAALGVCITILKDELGANGFVPKRNCNWVQNLINVPHRVHIAWIRADFWVSDMAPHSMMLPLPNLLRCYMCCSSRRVPLGLHTL